MSKHPILLTVFIHEDLKDANQDQLSLDHFDWVTDEISNISGQAMDVNFIEPSAAPSISTFNYKGTDLGNLLERLYANVLSYINSDHFVFDDRLHKFLLLTRHAINDKILGVAYQPGALAIASITHNVTAAHEVAHMFGARHEDAEESVETYYGPTKSTLYPTAEGRVAFRFSDKNRENIRKYLDSLD
ncbi:hypothetical protein SAMN04487857_103189 [Pseudomonas sp. ok272]|uniref:hypothetical protein n=1 Tax=unclassified Pseudomonas TaxID=196821 RepID=UPI0008B0F1CB|nr:MULTISPECIES: hypothetical protein [unclassified Pseudomonas]SEM61088.1 hypothetical protein SAMN04487857_103189 [Pseudomonas sp. ok272]SFM49235.1 hypothetical protein SAMN04487858_103246 [Pseudomonas sp. ok602]